MAHKGWANWLDWAIGRTMSAHWMNVEVVVALVVRHRRQNQMLAFSRTHACHRVLLPLSCGRHTPRTKAASASITCIDMYSNNMILYLHLIPSLG